MRKIIMFFAGIVIAGVSYSQTFMHGAGFSSHGLIVDNKSTGETDAGVYVSFNYSPRFSFLEGDNMSVSVGIPLAVGFGGSYSYSSSSYYGTEESNTLTYMISAPLIVDLNIGAGAHKEIESRFGFFVGGGLGVFHGTVASEFYDPNNYDYYTETQTVSSIGPAGNIGFRIAVGRNQKNIETRITYMKGLTQLQPHVFSLGASFNF